MWQNGAQTHATSAGTELFALLLHAQNAFYLTLGLACVCVPGVLAQEEANLVAHLDLLRISDEACGQAEPADDATAPAPLAATTLPVREATRYQIARRTGGPGGEGGAVMSAADK